MRTEGRFPSWIRNGRKKQGNAMEEHARYQMTGSVEELIFRNEKNGYTVAELAVGDELYTVIGTMPGVRVGETITVTGVWTRHPNFGEQFKADSVKRERPETAEAILKYLSSGAVKGVGAKTAEKIVALFGADALRVMEEEPLRLCQIKGITRAKAQSISTELQRDSGLREMMVSLGRYGIHPNEAVKIWKLYGSSYASRMQEDPYCLCEGGIGIDFLRADEIAAMMDKPQEDLHRVRAGLLYVLRHNAGNGHTCLPAQKLTATAARLLGVEETLTAVTLEELKNTQTVVSAVFAETEYIYTMPLFKAESYIAHRLRMHVRYPARSISGIENHIRAVETRTGLSYAPQQKEAIREALGKGLLLLTGGPGTGKTTTLQAMISILKEKGETVLLAAPTGRAAKRMSELTGEEAKTIHRLLQVEWDADDRPTFAKNEKNLLECDALVIDELSMVDVLLFESLLRAVPLGCRLILVGDQDQLPSVGPGNIAGDLLTAGILPTVQLTEVFRQAMESLIVTNAHRIVQGEMPVLNVKDRDFFFLPMRTAGGITELILELCEKRLPGRYGFSPLWDIQVLSPSRKGDLGTQELNRRLQAVLNPASPEKKEVQAGGTLLREGDKVIQIRNNYQQPWVRTDGTSGEGVFNGDIGVVLEIDRRGGTVTVQMDDKLVPYDFELLSELELAYALTVHKSQGSEFSAVVMPMYPGPKQLAYRNLLYTAITRAKSLLILAGQEQVVANMVENDRKTRRYTGLSYMLCGGEGK